MHTLAVLNTQESLDRQFVSFSVSHCLQFCLSLSTFCFPKFPSRCAHFSPPSSISNRHTHTHTHARFPQQERASATLPAKLTQHFSHNSFVTVMKQPWSSAGLHQYCLSTEPQSKRNCFKVFATVYTLSRFLQTALCLCVCLFACWIFAFVAAGALWIQMP